MDERPDKLLEEFWKQSSAAWSSSLKAMQEAQQAAMAQFQDQLSQQNAAQFQQSWQRSFEQLQQMQQQAWSSFFAGRPPAPPPIGDADALAQAVTSNFQSALQALQSASQRMAARLEAADPEALQRIWTGLAQEYAKDMAGLPDKFAPARSEELAKIVRELGGQQPGPEAKRYLERFVESLRVKAVQGAEHYVDPKQVQVGGTPRELVLETGSLKLYRYACPEGVEGSRPPLLMIYSVINRPWILDLVPGFSIIAHLLSRGIDVYLAEWEPAQPGNSDTLDDYLDPWLRQAVDRIRELSGAPKVHLFGYCIGGTLALMYAALRPDDVQSLIALTTPVTSTGNGILELLVNPALFPLDEIIAAEGMVPGKTIRAAIIAIKPYLEVLKWKAFYENLHDDRVMYLYYPLDRWANDNPDIPGAVFRSFIEEIYQEDRLASGATRIHDRAVDLAEVSCPVLNLVAEEDWIVPAASAERIAELVGPQQVRNERIPGPHVGIVLDPRTRYVWDMMADFVHNEAPAPAEPPAEEPTAEEQN